MKKITIGVLALSMIALLGLGIVAAFPFGNMKFNNDVTSEELTQMQEFHDSIQQAIANGDFQTWKSLMESQLTEENFNSLVERHDVMSDQNLTNKNFRGQFNGAGKFGGNITFGDSRGKHKFNAEGFETGQCPMNPTE